MEDLFTKHAERIKENEQSTKSAHHRIDGIEKGQENHETRIQSLEKADVKLFTNIDNLIKQMKEVMTMIKWFIATVIITLGGFLIWYIQNRGF